MSSAAIALRHAVRAYQLTLSRLFGGQCRFTPSCSDYAMQALTTHGAARGAVLAGRRILRCSPLCAGGHDPVPPGLTCTDANPETV